MPVQPTARRRLLSAKPKSRPEDEDGELPTSSDDDSIPATTPSKPPRARDSANFSDFTIVDHMGIEPQRKLNGQVYHTTFNLQIQLPNGKYEWRSEYELHMAHPNVVSAYWNTVRGGRKTHCDDQWHICRILNDRNVGLQREYRVQFVGSTAIRWQPESYVQENAATLLGDYRRAAARSILARKTTRKTTRKTAKKSGAAK